MYGGLVSTSLLAIKYAKEDFPQPIIIENKSEMTWFLSKIKELYKNNKRRISIVF